MSGDRVNEMYRSHSLLSAFHKGKYQGRAWRNKKLIMEVEGTNIEDVLRQLKERIDRDCALRIVASANSPGADVYIAAFNEVLEKINPNQMAMLRAHYHAAHRCLTPSALADAAGYKDIGGVNLWYGFLGQWLFEAMSEPLNVIVENGSPVYTSVLASWTKNPESSDSPNVWKMHDDVASAIRALNLCT